MANGTTITIDSDECVTRLTRAKFTKEQAEAVVKVLKKDVGINTSELATKKDLELLEERMSRKMYHAALLSVGINGTVVATLFVIFEFLR